jgi:hypothetical protein
VLGTPANGAWAILLPVPHRFHGGLRYFAPKGAFKAGTGRRGNRRQGTAPGNGELC